MRVGQELPLTILFKADSRAPAQSIGSSGHIAIRFTRHQFCRRLIAEVDQLMISTSANHSGSPAPPRFEDIHNQILEEADIVVKAGPRRGVASSLVVVENERPVILREGAVSMEMLLSKLEQT
jgi:tRNA A37 threonylcarbamoyladenosine synthetase subunit TsaC/SUA5/YrdC